MKYNSKLCSLPIDPIPSQSVTFLVYQTFYRAIAKLFCEQQYFVAVSRAERSFSLCDSAGMKEI